MANRILDIYINGQHRSKWENKLISSCTCYSVLVLESITEVPLGAPGSSHGLDAPNRQMINYNKPQYTAQIDDVL